MKTLLSSNLFHSSHLLLALCLCASTDVLAATLFTKITSDPIVSGTRATVAAWGDFNNDGFLDLVAAPYNTATLLYTNNGNGTFTRITTGPVATDSGASFGCVWADYDNDGALDLFIGLNSAGSDWLYHNNGNGTFTKITNGPTALIGGNANNCVWGDYDNDGHVDLYVANSDQNDFLYHNNGNGTFTRITNNAITLKLGNSQGASWGDYDNDGLIDLFVSRVNEPNILYHNLGNGSFVQMTNGAIVNESTASQGVSWGDYDNDGSLDLFVANPNARSFLYHNNGDGSFTKITNGTIATLIGNSHGCGWADYDNDGFQDLVVINRLGVSFLYHNNGDGTFVRVSNGEPIVTDSGEAFSGAWGDYNNDGFPDLFLSHFQTFNNALYRNNGNSNHWLTISCEGRLSNRSAIGAKVRVKATINGRTMWQLREISGGGGLGSQNDLRAGFGLGDATNAEIVRIEWPSGIVQQLTNVAAGQFLAIAEPGGFITPVTLYVPAGTNVVLTAHSDWPPPVQLQWSFNGAPLSGETNFELFITNVQRANLGSYTVSLTNAATGFSYTTRAATLDGAVVIHQQPVSQNIRVTSNVTFSVMATGFAPVTFQWQRNGINLSEATAPALIFTNVQIADEGIYSVIVSNSYGAVRSSNAELIALVRPFITVHPLSQSVVAGGSVTLSASASGYPAPLVFRWLRNGVVVSGNPSTDTNGFLTITNVQPPSPPSQLTYRVSVTNLAGNVTSATATLTVLADSDGDGLPDEWETAHDLDPSNSADAILDNDGDGQTNVAEYSAGTDPNDAGASLGISSLLQSNHLTMVRWLAVSNRTYTVQFCDTLPSVTWKPLLDITAALTNRYLEVLDAETDSTQRFYRVVSPRFRP